MTPTASVWSEPPASGIEHSRWVSLKYFNFFRLIVAAIFAFFGSRLELGMQAPALFQATAFAYLFAVLALGFPDALRRLGLQRLITLQVVIDIAVLTLMMWASGGYRSGLPMLMMVVLAGAGLVAQGRMVVFFAALATVGLLAENGWRYLSGRIASDFFVIGLACMGFFAIALSAHLLARRAQANEYLAAQRGAALANQQAVNERIIEDMPDGVLVIGSDGSLRQANPQASALLGAQLEANARLEEIAPTLLHQVWDKHNADPILQRLGPAGRLLRSRVVTAKSGETLIYLTDFDQLQRESQQAKLAALGRLTASIAHEIRNPLTAITHAAELLREENQPQTCERLHRIIDDNTRRIERMVRDVLALGRRDQARTEIIPLTEFLSHFVEELLGRGDAARGIFTLQLTPGLLVAFDRVHLHQILWNLCMNAQRYCGGGEGAIRILSRRNAQGEIEIRIADDGSGIGEAYRAQVFEPFFTTDSRGTGLGLYIARELAEANAATLDLADRPSTTSHTGAEFILTLREAE